MPQKACGQKNSKIFKNGILDFLKDHTTDYRMNIKLKREAREDRVKISATKYHEKCVNMKHFIVLLMPLLFTAGLAQPGVFIEADSDTVMKVKYSGASANDLTHPAFAVEGKALKVTAETSIALSIFDAHGRRKTDLGNYRAKEGVFSKTISMPTLTSGVYFVLMTANSERRYRQFRVL